jgi:hypothetical protein
MPGKYNWRMWYTKEISDTKQRSKQGGKNADEEVTPLTWHRAAILEGRTGRQMRPSPMPPSSAASDLMFHHTRRMDNARDSSQRKEG